MTDFSLRHTFFIFLLPISPYFRAFINLVPDIFEITRKSGNLESLYCHFYEQVIDSFILRRTSLHSFQVLTGMVRKRFMRQLQQH